MRLKSKHQCFLILFLSSLKINEFEHPFLKIDRFCGTHRIHAHQLMGYSISLMSSMVLIKPMISEPLSIVLFFKSCHRNAFSFSLTSQYFTTSNAKMPLSTVRYKSNHLIGTYFAQWIEGHKFYCLFLYFIFFSYRHL